MKQSFKLIIPVLLLLVGNKCYSQTISYCNERAAYTVKINGRNVTIYYTDLNHLDRKSISKGYIKKDKIYVKASPKSNKYVCEYAFNDSHQFLILNNKTKTWNVIRPCEAIPLDQNALYEGEDNWNLPGNQGKPNIDKLTNDYNGTGLNRDGNLLMNYRKFLKLPTVNYVNHNIGKVVIDLYVDQTGNITNAEIGRGTTIADSVLIRNCIEAVKKSKVTPEETAPIIQKGQVVFTFKVN